MIDKKMKSQRGFVLIAVTLLLIVAGSILINMIPIESEKIYKNKEITEERIKIVKRALQVY
ncbi:MAG: hypothetical protein COV36_03685, partial [Alphaproteobacteria bacterium CG11_big_fil_rev_8_21_14_0_20_44_7]